MFLYTSSELAYFLPFSILINPSPQMVHLGMPMRRFFRATTLPTVLEETAVQHAGNCESLI